MSSNRKPETDLTRLLRRGDPALEGESLPPTDVARMRRSMLAAIEAAVRPPLLPWRPVLAAAGSVALVFALGVAWWRLGPPAGSREEKLAVVVGVPEPPGQMLPAEPAGASRGTAAAQQQLTRSAPAPGAITPASRPARKPRPARPGPAAPRAAPASPAGAAVHAARQVEFETPGGTRVVWVLDPYFSLHPTEVQTR